MERNARPSHVNVELAQDFQRVDGRISSGRMRTIIGKIERGVAQPHQILEWHYAQDPINERLIRNDLDESDDSSPGWALNFAESYQMSILCEKAALQYFSRLGITDEKLDFTPQTLQKLQDGDFDADFASKIAIGADIIADAHGAADLVDTWSAIPDVKNGRLAHIMEEVSSRLTFAFKKKQEIRDVLSRNILGNDRITDPEILFIGLDALFAKVTAIRPEPALNPLESIRLFDSMRIEEMVGALRSVYLEKNVLRAMKGRSDLKGRLYEHLWILDAYVYKYLTNNVTTVVIPSHENQDRPRINYPRNNRSVDVFVGDYERGHEYYIQLKASHQRAQGSKYHPGVIVVSDQNFQDTNPGRLLRKLRAYEELLDDDSSEQARNKALEYVLPSVREKIDAVNSININDIFDQTYGIEPRNSGKSLKGIQDKVHKAYIGLDDGTMVITEVDK